MAGFTMCRSGREKDLTQISPGSIVDFCKKNVVKDGRVAVCIGVAVSSVAIGGKMAIGKGLLWPSAITLTTLLYVRSASVMILKKCPKRSITPENKGGGVKPSTEKFRKKATCFDSKASLTAFLLDK